MLFSNISTAKNAGYVAFLVGSCLLLSLFFISEAAAETVEKTERYIVVFDDQKSMLDTIEKAASVPIPEADSLGLFDARSFSAAFQSNKKSDKTTNKTPINTSHTYQNFPAAAFELTQQQLDEIRQNTRVVGLQKDHLFFSQLDSSTEVIGVDHAESWQVDATKQAIAVLDTGVDNENSFINIVSQACFSNNGGAGFGVASQTLCPNGLAQQIGNGAADNCTSTSECDHGTHVAGIAAGTGVGGHGGVAAGSPLIAIQVFTEINDASVCATGGLSAPCLTASTSDLIAGLDRVLELHNDVDFTTSIAAVNLSLGGGSYSLQSTCDEDNVALKASIDALYNQGIATFASAGNESKVDSISAPACISSVFSVGATTDSDEVASFSNSAEMLDFLAPGTGIVSSYPGEAVFGSASGTSMATPHVAGVWAWVTEFFPDLTIAEKETLLKNSGTIITDTRPGANDRSTSRVDLLNVALNQNGAPGGVIDNLQTWLKAEEGMIPIFTDGAEVSSWVDATFANSNASSQASYPLVQTNAINNTNAKIEFDGTSQALSLSNPALEDFSWSLVFSSDDALSGTLLTANDEQDGNGWTVDLNNGLISVATGADQRVQSTELFNDDMPHVLTITRDSNTGVFELFIDGQSQGGFTGTAGQLSNTLTIGLAGNIGLSSENFLEVDIAEVIGYDRKISDTERQKIESYLAAKFGIVLNQASYVSANDLLWYDASLAGDFMYDVGVIAQDDISKLNQSNTKSQTSTSIVNISNPSNLRAGGSLSWAHDGGDLLANTNVPGGYFERINRTWLVQKNNDIGTVDILFDVSGLSQVAQTSGGYALLIDQDADGDFSNADVAVGVLQDNSVVFSSVTLPNLSRFTIAYPPDTNVFNASAIALDQVAVYSSNQDITLAKAGDTITINFSAGGDLTVTNVTIAGKVAEVSGGPQAYQATYVVTDNESQGLAGIQIDYADAEGDSTTVLETTDQSSVSIDTVVPETPSSDVSDGAQFSSTSVSFAGAGEANAQVQIDSLSSSSGVCSAQVDTVGQWACAVNLSQGVSSLELYQTDLAGNKSASAFIEVVVSVPSNSSSGGGGGGGSSRKDCEDNRDNDKDGLTDEDDPGCHTDGDANNPDSYDPEIDDETSQPQAANQSPVSSPIFFTTNNTFTDQDLVRLVNLLDKLKTLKELLNQVKLLQVS